MDMRMVKMTFRLITTNLILLLSYTAHSQYYSMPFEGLNRTYLVHLPAGYPGSSDIPLIIAMHGGFGNAYNIETQSQLSVKADQAGFMVVYPEGVESELLGIRSWNAGWCCGYSSNNNINDAGFINALLDTLIKKYPVDIKRVYATGMSNGGFMAYRLACELSGRIAAIAPVAASMSMESCSPQRPVPVISFHSYLDTNVPYYGGIGAGVSNHWNAPQDSVLDAWAFMNSCTALNDTIVDNAQFTEIKRSNCDCNIDIDQYVTRDGGHSWPGGQATAVGDPVSKYINANDLMWEFFQQYSLDCTLLSVSNERKKASGIRIFPNPSNNVINIQTDIRCESIKITVFNSQGIEVLVAHGQTEINISHLPEGILLLKIEIDNYIETHTIIKTK